MNLELSTHFQHTEDRWSHRSTRDCMDKSEDLTSEEIPKFHEIANAVFSLCKYLKLSPLMLVILANAVLGHSKIFLTMFHRKTRLSDKMPLEILLIWRYVATKFQPNAYINVSLRNRNSYLANFVEWFFKQFSHHVDIDSQHSVRDPFNVTVTVLGYRVTDLKGKQWGQQQTSKDII